jgi:hypothetical protein
MRVVLAALFVVVVLGCAVAAIGALAPDIDFAPIWGLGIGLALSALFVALCLIAVYVFNRPEHRFAEFRSAESILRELGTRNLLVATAYRATRAFEVEECYEEGPHYFIELEDRSVLYLNGQYLYRYGPNDDDPEVKQARFFPCTEFAIRRHRDEGYVDDIVCGGSVLAPEVIATEFDLSDWPNGAIPKDGQIITDQSYEDLKRERIIDIRDEDDG